MTATVEVACKQCKSMFVARVADRKRGWAKFCSKSCKATKQEIQTGQHAAYLRGNGRSNGNFDDDDILESISDMDFGASDGGGYESIR